MNIEINYGYISDQFFNKLISTSNRRYIESQLKIRLLKQGLKFEEFEYNKTPMLLGSSVFIHDDINNQTVYIQIIYSFECKENRND